MNETQTAPVTLDSSRFGRIEVQPAAIITFPDGLIGVASTRYTLIATDTKSPFLWLHSVQDGKLALPVANPSQFFPQFRLELSQAEAQRLEIDESTPIDIYVTVRAAPVLSDFVANLRAPIVIHAGVGHQVINQAPDSALRAPLFPDAADAASSSAA